MPVYEYYCQQCQTDFEQIRSFSDADEPIPCPNCFNTVAKRSLSKIAISIKDNSSSKNTAGCTGCTSRNCSNCH